MKIDEYVRDANLLEEKYMSAINSLEPIDRAIILESIVNGTPYWKIGVAYGYTEESLRKKIDKILRKLAFSL